MKVPPDGTYIASYISPGRRHADRLTFYLDDGGAGYHFDDVRFAGQVRVQGLPRRVGTDARRIAAALASASRAAVTIEDGRIVAVDADQTRWDTNSPPGVCQRPH